MTCEHMFVAVRSRS